MSELNLLVLKTFYVIEAINLYSSVRIILRTIRNSCSLPKVLHWDHHQFGFNFPLNKI